MNGLLPLLRQRLRRDWLQLTLWILGTVLLALAGFSGVAATYGDEQDRIGILAAVMANPVILLFRGLPSGAESSAFIVFLLFPWLAILAAFMSSFLAVRHTRGDEESGRLELVAATPSSRWTSTVATLVHGVLANVALGLLVALSFLAGGAEAEGSFLVGAAAGATGVVFLAVALTAAQLMRSSRAANSLAVWVLLGTFLIAGFGNAIGTPSDDLQRMESSWLTWVSPFGWAENTRAFDENAWWPLALCLALAVVLVAAAFALQSARDLGGSILPERSGRAHARPALSSTTALVSRLTTPSAIGWMIGALISGALSTTLGSVVTEIGGENPAIADILQQLSGGRDLEQGIVVTFFIMVGLLAACAAVQTVVRARQEEAHGTAEAVLAAPVGRVRWLADFLIVGFAVVVLTCTAGFAGAALGASSGDRPDLAGDALFAAAGQVLAASVFLVLTALVFTVVPRATIGVGWALVVMASILGLFGPLLGFPEWTTNLSPFAVAPIPSGSEVDVRGMWWLVLAAVGGGAASLALMRRRELATGG